MANSASLAEPPAPLAGHLVLSSDDLDEAREAVGRVLATHTLEQLGGVRPLGARQYAARIGTVTLSHIGYGAPVLIGAGLAERFFCLQLPDRGRVEITQGSRSMGSTPAVASVLTPTEPLRMRWEPGTSMLVVKVAPGALERYLARLLGYQPAEPIRFELALRFDRDAGAVWPPLLDLLLAQIAVAGRGPNPGLSAATVEELVLSTMLLAQPNNHWERLARAGRPAGSPHVRRAIAYAHEHLDTPLTVDQLAAAAGVTVRALQVAFQRTLGCAPTTWIRDQRLERVRAELAAAEPGDGTHVTDVALRWGFVHFGRFAQVYRQRFGERPSETLRGASTRR